MCQRLLNSFVTCTQQRAWNYRNRIDKFSLLGKYQKRYRQSMVKLTIVLFLCCVTVSGCDIPLSQYVTHMKGITYTLWWNLRRSAVSEIVNHHPHPTVNSSQGCFMPRNVASPTGPRTGDPPLSPLLFMLDSVRTLATGQNYFLTHKMRLSCSVL